MWKQSTALACILGLTAGPALAQDKIRIGFISTFSGPTAVIGNDMKNSAELALEHLGRKMGGKAVEMVYEDDQQKPDVGKQKTDKLVQQDKVPIVAGYIWSNVLLSSYKSAADAGVFAFSSNAGASPTLSASDAMTVAASSGWTRTRTMFCEPARASACRTVSAARSASVRARSPMTAAMPSITISTISRSLRLSRSLRTAAPLAATR